MYNVIKAQKYQLVRDNFTYIAFFCGFVMMWAFLLISSEDGFHMNEAKASGYIANGGASVIATYLMLVFTTRICGDDLKDKTINYEMLTGRKRSTAYFGRLFVSVAVGVIVYLVFCILPVIVIGAVYGWGYTMPVNEGVKRLVLDFIPLLRLICVFACITFITRSPLGSVALGFILTLIESLFIMLSDEQMLPFGIEKLAPFLSMASSSVIATYNMKMDYIDGKDVGVVKDMLSANTVIMLVVSGIIACIVSSLLGYTVFRKKDMD